MNFWFCETCGKRLTDKDIDTGSARNKKLKGVFCKECAVGVLTMETVPLSESEARKLLKEQEKAALPRPSGEESRISPGSPRTHNSPRRPSRESISVIVAACAFGLMLFVLAGYFALSGKKDPVTIAPSKSSPPAVKKICRFQRQSTVCKNPC
jgi:hypothetical protein